MLPVVPESDTPPPRQFKLKPKEFERVNAPRGTDAKSDDHDVFAIRQHLREREQSAGLDDHTSPPPKKSRRTRDFWVSAALGSGAVLALGGVLAGHNGLVVGAGLSLALTIGLWWIFFHIMDNY
jgi:hypothetical protein